MNMLTPCTVSRPYFLHVNIFLSGCCLLRSSLFVGIFPFLRLSTNHTKQTKQMTSNSSNSTPSDDHHHDQQQDLTTPTTTKTMIDDDILPVTSITRPKIHSSEILYTGFLELQCDTLLLPPDFTKQYKYYKLNSKGNNAVFVVAKTTDDQFIVNKEYRHPTNTDYVYGFPGGLIDRGETPEQAAQRELLEETGYWAPLDQFKRIGSSYPLPGVTGLQMYYVMVHDAEKRSESSLEPSENLITELMSEHRVDEVLTAQMIIEESEEKAQEHTPRALNVDGNFVTALWYYQKHKQLMATKIVSK